MAPVHEWYTCGPVSKYAAIIHAVSIDLMTPKPLENYRRKEKGRENY